MRGEICESGGVQQERILGQWMHNQDGCYSGAGEGAGEVGQNRHSINLLNKTSEMCALAEASAMGSGGVGRKWEDRE